MLLASLSPAPILRRKCACGGTPGPTGECEACRKKRLGVQRKAAVAGPAVAPSIVHDVLSSAGRPLDAGIRAEMEPRFHHSFADVRVHADGRAAGSAQAVAAQAYTVGRDVVFAAGRYAPESGEGRRLIAHELAHVVQQRGASPSLQPRLEIGGVDDAAEREADAAADAALAGGGTGGLGRSDARLRRVPSPGIDEEGELSNAMEAYGGAWRGGRPPAGRTGMSHGVIPYREATEYAECLRIMGPENTAYCRQVVLGERPPAPPSRQDPLSDLSTFQSPGASGWWGARFGCYRNTCSRRHKGWDVHAASGTPARAAESGTVTHHNDPGGYGTYLKLASTTHPDLVFLYGHLSARQPAGSYNVGDHVGDTGTSGNASADRPHLHLEVHLNGTAVDPNTYFTEPSQVIEATGSSATAIDKTLPAPCSPC